MHITNSLKDIILDHLERFGESRERLGASRSTTNRESWKIYFQHAEDRRAAIMESLDLLINLTNGALSTRGKGGKAL